MEEVTAERMPTGISSLDPVLDGGIPPGSVVLLSGTQGSGNREFVYSSVIFLGNMKKTGQNPKNAILPEEIAYITFTRLSSSILKEISLSFKKDLIEGIEESIKFIDLSEIYFESTIVPTGWYSDSTILERFQKRSTDDSLIGALAAKLNDLPSRSLIVIDAISDVATGFSTPTEWKEIVGFLRGLQRISKKWNSTIMILISEGILPEQKFMEVADCCDALVNFSWEESSGRKRQRIMFFEKFAGVMPHLEENDLVKFGVKISPEAGFEVSNIRVVI
ncbi:RAD55 family ATPase [Methanoplanus endosymbiosus]|uniref:KaiC-like domain-containing protein n=1 Tax=Methanoplanus endosymbiosus TaxID=33865 RepID=A0A9E7PP30_9EURY|nr:ATPase domain-containing protein [Methanoplanus endosymbiosus]UUX93830.1 hypothetical protein L6E24_06870 [Methanoplanus endosymbiosus]